MKNTDYPQFLTFNAQKLYQACSHCPECLNAFEVMNDVANGRATKSSDLVPGFVHAVNAGRDEKMARHKDPSYQKWSVKQATLWKHQKDFVYGATPAYETLPGGGRQTAEKDRYDLIPPESIEALARVHGEGAAKHGEGNWRNIPVGRHLGRALGHITRYLAGDRSEPHLEHALCRVNMAYALSLSKDTGPTEWRGQ